jgi:hypothetical protein
MNIYFKHGAGGTQMKLMKLIFADLIIQKY